MYADDTHTTIVSNDITELISMTKKQAFMASIGEYQGRRNDSGARGSTGAKGTMLINSENCFYDKYLFILSESVKILYHKQIRSAFEAITNVNSIFTQLSYSKTAVCNKNQFSLLLNPTQ